nr:MAG TPA: Major capsid protein [Microviridae sp.]
MASYTGMSNLQNHPHRSGFDIGRKNAFTAKVGELLPVYWDISMPGDKYKFDIEYFTRTQPVETSAYTRLREYFDFYAVPLRLLWKSAPSVLTQMQDVNQIQALSLTKNLSLGTYLPSISLNQLGIVLSRLNGGDYSPAVKSSLTNMFGFFRADLSFKLLNYLGYGNLVHPCS